MRIPEDALLEETKESIYDLIRKSIEEATRNDIKANSIVINRNMVRVPGWEGRWPEMICGLSCYFTATALPDGYSFAVLNDCNKETENNWISVKDRLPTIYDADADNCVLAIHKASNKRYYHWRSVADNPFDFTHWMKTPQPPKGD